MYRHTLLVLCVTAPLRASMTPSMNMSFFPDSPPSSAKNMNIRRLRNPCALATAASLPSPDASNSLTSMSLVRPYSP